RARIPAGNRDGRGGRRRPFAERCRSRLARAHSVAPADAAADVRVLGAGRRITPALLLIARAAARTRSRPQARAATRAGAAPYGRSPPHPARRIPARSRVGSRGTGSGRGTDATRQTRARSP